MSTKDRPTEAIFYLEPIPVETFLLRLAIFGKNTQDPCRLVPTRLRMFRMFFLEACVARYGGPTGIGS